MRIRMIIDVYTNDLDPPARPMLISFSMPINFHNLFVLRLDNVSSSSSHEHRVQIIQTRLSSIVHMCIVSLDYT